MTELVQEQRLALEPLRRALLADAHAEADQMLRAAEEAGRKAVAAAEEEVAAMLNRAWAEGEADGVALRSADRARARSVARTGLLAARRGAYEELRRSARAAVRELLGEPGKREQLAEALCGRLGGRAQVSEADDGGLLVRAPDGRSIDASVAALVDGALTTLDLEQLWTAG